MRVLKLSFSCAGRFRMYTSDAARDADVARPIGTDPTGDEHGVLLDVVDADGVGTFLLSPAVDVYIDTPVGGDSFPVTFTNLSGGTVAEPSVAVEWIQTEMAPGVAAVTTGDLSAAVSTLEAVDSGLASEIDGLESTDDVLADDILDLDGDIDAILAIPRIVMAQRGGWINDVITANDYIPRPYVAALGLLSSHNLAAEGVVDLRFPSRAGYTTQYRLATWILTNGVAVGRDVKFSIRSLAGSAGASDAHSISVNAQAGAVTHASASLTSSGIHPSDGAWATAPSSGLFIPNITLVGGVATANVLAFCFVTVEARLIPV